MILWGGQLFCKPAHTGLEVPWHQDGQYWPITPLATCSSISVLDGYEPALNGVAADPWNPQVLYAAAGPDAYRIRYRGAKTAGDCGRTSLRTGSPVTALAIDPDDPQILYTAVQGQGIFRSGDTGRSVHSAIFAVVWSTMMRKSSSSKGFLMKPSKSYSSTSWGST